MKKNLKQKKSLIIFIIFLSISFILLGVSAKKKSEAISNIISYISSPFQKAIFSMSSSVKNSLSPIFKKSELKQENLALREEIATLKKQLIDFYKYKNQNEELLKILNIKDSTVSLSLTSCLVIGRISNDPFKSFIIDKGAQDDIKIHDCVVTADGLIGYVSEVNSSCATVKTILNKDVAIGIYNINNCETGVLSGDISFAKENKAKMKYLSRQSSSKRGDVLITSGVGDNFPKGIFVGEILEIKQEPNDTSYFGLVKSSCDFDNLTHVFVITSFSNKQRNIEPIFGQSPLGMSADLN